MQACPLKRVEGLKDAVTPLGSPLTDNERVSANPLIMAVDTETEPPEPWLTEMGEWVTAILKSLPLPLPITPDAPVALKPVVAVPVTVNV